nr:hypothetical protein [Tanacetum cinerariifolium]
LTTSKDLDNLIESQRSDKSKEGLGYTAVPPPPQLYLSPKKDLSQTGLPECPDFVMKKKACFNCDDFNHLAYEGRRRVKRGTTRTSFNKSAHSYTNRPFQRKSAVKTQYRALWMSTVNRNFPPVNRKFSTGSRNFPTGSTKNPTADMGIKEKAGSSQNKIDDKGYWDSGCSRHMTGNISYLSNFEPYDEGYMSFGQGGCKITGKRDNKNG